jgi:hypothetical protein
MAPNVRRCVSIDETCPHLEYTRHVLSNAPGLNVIGEKLTEIQGGDMGGLQKRRSVLNVRKSPQIDETCYIPRMYVPYARHRV